ncbi:MAG: T9SS type A sorting domain-containing protein [candidate division WOR-3 bacterium]
MRKLIIFLLLISFTLFGRKYYVPEEFSTLQQGISFANDFDTISVFFGRELGKKEIVGMDIFGKKLIFEIRGGEKEMFLEEMKNFLNNLPQRDNRNRQYPPPGWQGQKQVNEPDGLGDWSFQHHCIKFDNLNRPWVFWTGRWYDRQNIHNFATFYGGKEKTGWIGDMVTIFLPGPERWDAPIVRGAILENTPYIVSNVVDPLNRWDVYFTYYKNGREWEEKKLVNLFDSTEYDFGPDIDAKEGKMWVTWFGGPRDDSIYSIYSTKWNGKGWEKEEVISFEDDEYHDWCQSVAVDNRGNPHVVWIAVDLFPPYEDVIFYRYYDGTRWSKPETVCKGFWLQYCFHWSMTYITLDEENIPHIIFDAIIKPPSRSEIFYSTKTNGRWIEPIQITKDDHRDCAIDITVFNSTICLGWQRYYGWYDSVHSYLYFNNRGISEIISIQPSLSDPNFVHLSGVEFDYNGNLWIIYNGIPINGIEYEVWYDIYSPSNFIKESSFYDNLKIKNLFISPIPYTLAEFADAKIEIYDKTGKLIERKFNLKREESIKWKGKKGIYFIIIQTIKGKIRIPVILIK